LGQKNDQDLPLTSHLGQQHRWKKKCWKLIYEKKNETVLFCDSKLLKWSFAEMGVSLPLNHPFFFGMFHDRPTILGTPIDGNPKYERLLFREGVLEAQ